MNKKKKGRKKSKKNNFEKFIEKNSKKLLGFGAIIICIVAIFAMISSGGNSYVLKSEYNMGELGYIDDIEITLTEAKYINNDTGVEVSFEITNKRDNTITIIPDDYFVFYDINQVQIPNKFTNDKNIIKKDETLVYKLQYDVTKKELYEIYFYSQIVENNIKFSFKANDISDNNIIEENVVPEEELEELE